MKAISTAASAALTDGTAIVSVAITIACTPIFQIWGGYGTLTLSGQQFTGVGNRSLVTVSGGAIGDSEQNVTMSLSGIDAETIALFDAQSVKGAACQIWKLIFDGAGQTLLDAHIYTSGRLDTLEVQETVGGASTIVASVETQARGLGRVSQRMRTDADQRLVNANDGGFRIVSFAGNKSLYWGGQKPTSASTLGWNPLPGTGHF